MFPTDADFAVSNAAGVSADMKGYTRTQYVVTQKGGEINWGTTYPAFYNAVNSVRLKPRLNIKHLQVPPVGFCQVVDSLFKSIII